MPRRLILELLGAVVIASVAATSLFAEGVKVAYQPPHDIAEELAKFISLTVAVAATLLILHTLLFKRARLDEAATRWRLFLGVCVLPFPVMFLSTAVGLEQSKTVGFCQSCHVMHTFINDMHDPGSQTLAAIHYKNRLIQREHCYRCHTNYGIFGDVEAKLVGLGHVWKETTGTYHLPIEISKPYRYTICLDCHGQALNFLTNEAHDGVIEAVLAGEAICGDCHDAAHPPRAARSTE